MTGKFNRAQRIVANIYGDGDFQHVRPGEIHDVGDTLFTFLMVELSDDEGCDDVEEARRRVRMAIDELVAVGDALLLACISTSSTVAIRPTRTWMIGVSMDQLSARSTTSTRPTATTSTTGRAHVCTPLTNTQH